MEIIMDKLIPVLIVIGIIILGVSVKESRGQPKTGALKQAIR